MAINIKGGNTTKKANRANIWPLSSENQPRSRARLPHRMMAKNGMVIERTSSITNQLWQNCVFYIEAGPKNIVEIMWIFSGRRALYGAADSSPV
jgi:hypothetical protein